MLKHDCVISVLFALAGEDGNTYSWADLHRVITFLDGWLRKREFEQDGQFRTYTALPEGPANRRSPILPVMHTFEQFVANLGTSDEEYSVHCKFKS